MTTKCSQHGYENFEIIVEQLDSLKHKMLQFNLSAHTCMQDTMGGWNMEADNTEIRIQTSHKQPITF